MSPSEALLYFTIQVTRANKELGQEVPVVVSEINFNDAFARYHGKLKRRVAAYVQPCAPGFECERKIFILSDQLSTPKKAYLQCVARHEVSHLALGHLHGAKDEAEDAVQHEMVKILMRTKWSQDSSCTEEAWK